MCLFWEDKQSIRPLSFRLHNLYSTWFLKSTHKVLSLRPFAWISIGNSNLCNMYKMLMEIQICICIICIYITTFKEGPNLCAAYEINWLCWCYFKYLNIYWLHVCSTFLNYQNALALSKFADVPLGTLLHRPQSRPLYCAFQFPLVYGVGEWGEWVCVEGRGRRRSVCSFSSLGWA